MSLPIRAPLPPRLLLHAANVLRATEIHAWGRDAATVRLLPPEGGAARLTVGHFKNGGPAYDDALSRLGYISGTLLLMLPTDLAAALHRQLDSCEGLRVGWEAIADGNLLALLQRGAADGCQWGALVPHPAGLHTYMTTHPRGHPRPAWDDLIAAFHDHRFLPDDTWQEVRQKTLSRDYRCRVCARLLELCDPRCQRWDDLWLRRLGPWLPASHLPHTCHLRSANGRQQVPAVLPGGPRARADARKRGLCTGASGGRKPPHTDTRAPQSPPSCGSTCTCGTPRPSRTRLTCSRPDARPSPRLAEPAAPCLAEGGMGQSTPVPAAKHRRRLSAAW